MQESYPKTSEWNADGSPVNLRSSVHRRQHVEE
jgi:hypothetical protein